MAKKKQCLSWPAGREVMTTSSGRVGGYQLSITNSAKHLSQTYHRAGQLCFGLLALISRPQVRYIHLSERMILPFVLEVVMTSRPVGQEGH